jgi:dual specificity MAP kinase phosphatase
VLIHCADGYTETSLVALTYLILTRRCSAPDAYLFLQLEAQRSFFVYPADSKLLAKVEARVSDVLAREEQELAAARQGRWEAEMESDDTATESSGMERSDSGYVSDASTPTKASVSMGRENTTSPTPQAEAPLPSLPKMELSSADSHPWFFGETFEGHFPSRILPFLVSVCRLLSPCR